MTPLTHFPMNGLFGGLVPDVSGNGYHGTPTNVTYGVGKIGRAGIFDGTAYIALPNAVSSSLGGKSGVTVSCWAKRGSIGVLQIILGLFVYGTLNKLFLAFDAANKIYVGGRSTYPENLQAVVSTDALTDTSDYHHIVATINLATDKILIYLDGELVATTGSPSFAQTTFSANTGNTSYVGAHITTTYRYDGVLDDVRIYNEELPPWETRKLFNFGKGTEKCEPGQRLVQPTIQPLIGV